MTRTILALTLTLAGCECLPPTMPIADAGSGLPDAFEADAPFVCVPQDTCPPGCSWTPCGCASDNVAVSCQ